jgi:hypothetical protein
MAFSLKQFRRKRALRRVWGGLLFWMGLLMLLADMTSEFPTPVRGAYALWWLILVAFGAYFWVSSRRLPLEETIQLAREPIYFGELRVTELTGELNISLETAERIFGALVRKGYARAEDRGDTRVWVFPDVKAAGPVVRRATPSRTADRTSDR